MLMPPRRRPQLLMKQRVLRMLRKKPQLLMELRVLRPELMEQRKPQPQSQSRSVNTSHQLLLLKRQKKKEEKELLLLKKHQLLMLQRAQMLLRKPQPPMELRMQKPQLPKVLKTQRPQQPKEPRMLRLPQLMVQKTLKQLKKKLPQLKVPVMEIAFHSIRMSSKLPKKNTNQLEPLRRKKKPLKRPNSTTNQALWSKSDQRHTGTT